MASGGLVMSHGRDERSPSFYLSLSPPALPVDESRIPAAGKSQPPHHVPPPGVFQCLQSTGDPLPVLLARLPGDSAGEPAHRDPRLAGRPPALPHVFLPGPPLLPGHLLLLRHPP